MAEAPEVEMNEKELFHTIEDLGIEEVEEIPEPEPTTDLTTVAIKREDTRGILALVFLIGFFVILVLGMIVGAINEGDKVESVTAILLAISGILSGPLGFVVGYYFRSQDSK